MCWRERLNAEPQWADFQNWPVIDNDQVPRSVRQHFMRNMRIVAAVLEGAQVKAVAGRFALTSGRVSQLLERCLGGDASAPPALTVGLLPGHNLKARRRSSDLPTLANTHGEACAFQALLDSVPGLRHGLDRMILAKLRDDPGAQRLTPGAFHGAFKRLLAEAHWPRDRYPYTTATLGYESVRRYLHTRRADLEREHLQRRTQSTRALESAPIHRALQRVQIDAHRLDIEGRAHLVLNDELIPLRLSRASVLVAVDVDTHCILGYHLALSREPDTQDLLALLANCLAPWKPLALATPGLSYAPGAGFPNGLALDWPISFGTVQLDNAMIHHAQAVQRLLVEQMGATLSYGPPGSPTVRQLVESVFDFINERCTHRAASTTGSSPTDPVKESRRNRRSPPLISVQTVNEGLSVMFAEANASSLPALGNAAPLALFEHHCRSHYIRYVPPELTRQWQPMRDTEEVALHWARQEGRRPHVNFLYARYSGPGLAAVAGRVKRIRVKYDRRDLRILHAYTLDGQDLGEIYAPKSWQRFPHSVTTRLWIHRNWRALRFHARDPLSAFFQHLLEHKNQPSSNLSLMRVYTEFTAGLTAPLNLEPASQPPSTNPSSPHAPDLGTSFDWSPAHANQRRNP